MCKKHNLTIITACNNDGKFQHGDIEGCGGCPIHGKMKIKRSDDDENFQKMRNEN